MPIKVITEVEARVLRDHARGVLALNVRTGGNSGSRAVRLEIIITN